MFFNMKLNPHAKNNSRSSEFLIQFVRYCFRLFALKRLPGSVDPIPIQNYFVAEARSLFLQKESALSKT